MSGAQESELGNRQQSFHQMMTGSSHDDSQRIKRGKWRRKRLPFFPVHFHFACFNSGLEGVSAIGILWSAGSETSGSEPKVLDNRTRDWSIDRKMGLKMFSNGRRWCGSVGEWEQIDQMLPWSGTSCRMYRVTKEKTVSQFETPGSNRTSFIFAPLLVFGPGYLPLLIIIIPLNSFFKPKYHRKKGIKRKGSTSASQGSTATPCNN